MSFIGTGIAAGAAAPAVAGGAAVAGGMSLGTGAMLLGAGTGLYSALGGGSSGGFSPASSISMTPRGKELESSLYKSLKTDLFPENLASKFLGDAKKMAQARKRISSSALASTTGPESAVSGNVARGLLAETSARFGDASAGERKVGQEKRAFSLERLNKLQNFINLQSGSTVMQAQADLIRDEQQQLSGARTGAGIGSIAQLLALGATNPYRS